MVSTGLNVVRKRCENLNSHWKSFSRDSSPHLKADIALHLLVSFQFCLFFVSLCEMGHFGISGQLKPMDYLYIFIHYFVIVFISFHIIYSNCYIYSFSTLIRRRLFLCTCECVFHVLFFFCFQQKNKTYRCQIRYKQNCSMDVSLYANVCIIYRLIDIFGIYLNLSSVCLDWLVIFCRSLFTSCN